MIKNFTLLLLLSFQACLAQTAFFPTMGDCEFQFGVCLDLYGNEIVASGFSNEPIQEKKVHVFTIDGTTIEQTAILDPEDSVLGGGYGGSISLENKMLAVGAAFQGFAGEVYAYRKIAGVWTQIQKIVPEDITEGSMFGAKLKIYNRKYLIISAHGDGVNNTTTSGSIYIYTFDGNQWIFLQKLTANNVQMFGSFLDVENDRLVITNPVVPASYYTYILEDNVWIYQSQMDMMGAMTFHLSGNRMFMIGNGVAPIYEYANGSWNFVEAIQLSSEGNLSGFGWERIKNIGNDVFIGAINNFLPNSRFPVMHYRKIGEQWELLEQIFGDGPIDQNDNFGTSLAVYDNKLLVGAYNESGTGMAYLYTDVAQLSTPQTTKGEYTIYPNPVKDNLYISNKSGVDMSRIEIYSISGELLLVETQNFDSLSVDGLSSGIYFAKTTFIDSSVVTKKLFKP